MADPTLPIAFAAGLLSFASPCMLPMVPGFLGYLAGISLKDLQEGDGPKRFKIFTHSAFFVLGLALVFSAFGVLINSAFSGVSYDARLWAGRIGGVLIILFGLELLGLLRIPLPRRGRQLNFSKMFEKRSSYLASFAFGSAFAVGWTPCVGVILGSVLTLAAVAPGNAFGLLFAYTLGLGIPFLLAGLFADRFAGGIQRHQNAWRHVGTVAGLFLVGVGVLVFTNNLNLLANFFFLNQLLLSQ
ncbi:MAG: cytochrome c biogenesis protein CcdA [Halobacteria archaeon]